MVSDRPDFLRELARPKRTREFDSLSFVPLHGASLSLHRVHRLDHSVAEPRHITRINTDAGDGVAYLLLPRLTLRLCSDAPCACCLRRSARLASVDPVCACA
jgi:hypothetical protein